MSKGRSLGGLVSLLCLSLMSADAEPPHHGGSWSRTQKKRQTKVEPSPDGERYPYDGAKGGEVEQVPVPKSDVVWDDRQVAANQAEIKRRVYAAGCALDHAERHAAEWGHASISSAVLVNGTSSRFSIGAGNDYNYFETKIRASKQGAAARYAEKFLGVRVEAQGGVSALAKKEDQITSTDLETKLIEAEVRRKRAELELKKLNKASSAEYTKEDVPTEPVEGSTETSPTESAPATTDGDGSTDTADSADAAADTAATGATSALLPTLTPSTKDSTGAITNLFVGGNYNQSQELLKTGGATAGEAANAPDLASLALVADSLSLSEGEILKSAGSSLVTQKILNYLTQPVEPGSNNIPWFMVTQVSVSPGSRTSQDYAAETTLHPYYATVKDGKVVPDLNPHHVHPGIFAAFPLVEAQALDLRNSDRFETRFSMALAAKLLSQGKTAEAKFFLEKITKIQQDVATRTMLPIVVPNSNGRDVTYRFDPALQALVEPGNHKKGSGQVLQPNSIPALIVIMTDRKSLDENTHLFFNLHTRWIPKKQQNIWSTTWNGITRNYDSRVGMQPSDVIDAAVHLDVAKNHLDWADRFAVSKLPLASTVTGLHGALAEARNRYSALVSKLGSSDSIISLPVHFSVSPEVLRLESHQEHHVLVENVSARAVDIAGKTMEKVAISGFEFVPKSEYEEAKQNAGKLMEDSNARQMELSKEFATRLDESALVIGKAISQEATKPPGPENSGPLPTLPKSAKPDSDQLKRVEELATGLRNNPEALSTLKGDLESIPEVIKASDLLKNAAGKTIVSQSAIDEKLEPHLENHSKAVRAKTRVESMGYFAVTNSERNSFVVTLPVDRVRNVPPGKHPVIGYFGGNTSFTFGSITIEPPAVTDVLVTAGEEIPVTIPKNGHVIALTGRNLDQVKCAFWSQSREQVSVISRGRETLQLLVTSAASRGEKFILLSDSFAPPEADSVASILDYVAVKFATPEEKPKPKLSLATTKLEVLTTKWDLKVGGVFPESVSVMLTGESVEQPLAPVFNTDRTEATFSFDKVLDLHLFPVSASKPKEYKLTFTSPFSKEPSVATVLFRENRAEIAAVYPTKLLNGDLKPVGSPGTELEFAL